jgi:hypothetical protein
MRAFLGDLLHGIGPFEHPGMKGIQDIAQILLLHQGILFLARNNFLKSLTCDLRFSFS